MTLTQQKTKGVIGDIISHPLRVSCLVALANRKASAAQLAREFKVDPGTTDYHVKKLLKAGAIELIETVKNNGADEALYRAVQRPLMNDEESAALSDDERTEWVERVLGLITADASASLQAGTFSERPDHNIVRFPTNVDEQGWKDLNKAAEQFLERAYDVEAETCARGGGDISVRVVSLVFEMPR